jgi:hypothetical protein
MLRKTVVSYLVKRKEWGSEEIKQKKMIAAQTLCQLAKVPVLFNIHDPKNAPQLFFKPIHPAIIEPPWSYPVYSPKVIKISDTQ